MDVLFQTVIVVTILLYGLTVLYAGWRYHITGKRLMWLAGIGLFASLANATYLLPHDFQLGNFRRGALLIVLNIGLLGAGGALALLNVTPPHYRKNRLTLWGLVIGVWLVGFVGAILVTPDSIAGQPDWFIQAFRGIDAPAIVTFMGYGVAGLTLGIYAFWRFYRAGLPEIANRTLFWTVIIALLFFNAAIAMSGTVIVAVMTMPLTVIALAGMAYALHYHHVLDVRLSIAYSLRGLVSVALGAGMTMTALVLALNANPQSDGERLLLVVGLAIGMAVIYVIIRQLVDYALRWMANRTI
jgi:hypothetical protein